MIFKQILTFILQNQKNQIDLNVDGDIIFNEYNHVVNIVNDNLKKWQNNWVRVVEK